MDKIVMKRRLVLRQMTIIHKDWMDGKKPPDNDPLSVATLCFICCLVALMFHHSFIVLLISVVAVFIFFLALYYRGVFLPKPWSEQLDKKLTDYQPADVEAFKKLQNTVTEHGELTPDIFGGWLKDEHNAVMPERKIRKQYTFASRIIQDDKDARP